MKSFGSEEYGNKSGFALTCHECGKEMDIIPTHHYSNGDYSNPIKITLEIRCICGNKFGATIHSK